MARTVPMVLLVVVVGGCAGSYTRTQGLIRDGDIPGAVEAAGVNPPALNQVSVAILARGLERHETRAVAARGLAAAGDLAQPRLEELLEAADPVVSAHAASLILELDPEHERGEAVLNERLSSPDPEARVVAVRALGRTTRDASFYRARLADPDARVRRAAVETLGRHGGEGVAGRLVEELVDFAAGDDPAAQTLALRALARLDTGGEALIRLASEALGSPRLAPRLAAVTALSSRADRDDARGILRRVVAGQGGIEGLRAALILARRGDTEVLPRLEAALTEGEPAQAATVAVGAAGIEALEPALLRALDRPEPEVRLNAAASLLGTGSRPRASEVLHDLLSESGWIGVQAGFELANEGHGAGLSRLERGLESDDPAIRAFVASVASLLPEGLTLARRALADREASVRVAAAGAVVRLLRRRA